MHRFSAMRRFSGAAALCKKKPLPNVEALWPHSIPGKDVSLHSVFLSPTYHEGSVRMGSLSIPVEPVRKVQRREAAGAAAPERQARGLRPGRERFVPPPEGATEVGTPFPIDIGDPDEALLQATASVAQMRPLSESTTTPSTPWKHS